MVNPNLLDEPSKGFIVNPTSRKGVKRFATSGKMVNNDSQWKWRGSGPIFWEVIGKFDCGELDVGDPASNQHDSNPATVTPLLHWLSTKHNLIDLAKKAVPASESKNTSKKV